jgi:hypothetical protein
VSSKRLVFAPAADPRCHHERARGTRTLSRRPSASTRSGGARSVREAERESGQRHSTAAVPSLSLLSLPGKHGARARLLTPQNASPPRQSDLTPPRDCPGPWISGGEGVRTGFASLAPVERRARAERGGGGAGDVSSRPRFAHGNHPSSLNKTKHTGTTRPS